MIENFPYEERLKSVRKILDLKQLDGILFSSLENIRYLCGFTGTDGALLIIRKESFFLTDSRYWTQSEEEVKGSQIVHYRKKMEGIFSLLYELKLRKIGFESMSLPFSAHQFLVERLPPEAKLIPLEDEIKNVRALKDKQELSLLKASIEIASKAYLEILELLKEGAMEREAALEMEWSMKRKGAEALGFDIIIASGKRSALPHGKASSKRVEKGDFILMDFGSEFQGYHSDQTRTVVCGNPSSEQQKIYRIVKEAHDKAIEKVRPGIPIEEVDGAARSHIRNEGYGEYFGHGLGHGIGLAVHEDPVVNGENKGLVQEGMVFTIEPGIYIPDWGGVRIEDMVLATPHGAELLTYLPTELREI
ncbi:MAG: M24 family metallopeptidase [Thermodesulfobacteriota bacterium]|jgi:Xaa-Pro aminopeptidase